jgi:hypothetical protein
MPRETKAVRLQRTKEIRERYEKSLSNFINSRPQRYNDHSLDSMLSIGKQMRSEFKKYRLLNGAITAYQDLASTREWTVSGKETAVQRTVEAINGVETWDYTTGMTDVGFEQHLRRLSLDYVTIGRIAQLFRGNADTFEYMYLDPTVLYYNQQLLKMNKSGNYDKIRPDFLIWGYGSNSNSKPLYKWNEVRLAHPIPVGVGGFISPTLLVYPMALMAWLIQEHDSAKADGRKLRDILLVDQGLSEPIMEVLESSLQLWSGADPTKVGVPIVEISQPLNGKLQDRIAHLGLSEIPENFDREAFDHMYANQIASSLGLALRQFWQDDSNTNRALEEVQEARQQLKGPLAFVRAVQRMMNESSVVRLFSPASRPSKFAFMEEADTGSFKERADAMKSYAEALLSAGTAVGARLKPEPLIRKFQEYDLLPADMTIEEMLMTVEEVKQLMEQQQVLVEDDTVRQSPDQRTNTADEITQLKILKTYIEDLSKKTDDLGENEIKMTGDYKIIDRRRPTYSIDKILKSALEKQKLLDPDAISRYDDESNDNGDKGSLLLAGVFGSTGS